jgi:hypothetical protein
MLGAFNEVLRALSEGLRAFNDILGSFATWMQFVISPSRAVTGLTKDVASSDSIVPVIKIWFAAVFIARLQSS